MRHWSLNTGDSSVAALIHAQGVFYPWTHLMATLILVATITINSDKVHCWLYIISVQPLCLLVITFCKQQWDEGWWSGKICHYCSGLYNLRERSFQNKKRFSHLHVEYFIILYNCVKLQVTLSRQAGLFLERPGNFSGLKANFKVKKTCWIVNQYFYYIIFKIIGTLILNANKTNTKQLFGPENLSGLSRNRPQ